MPRRSSPSPTLCDHSWSTPTAASNSVSSAGGSMFSFLDARLQADRRSRVQQTRTARRISGFLRFGVAAEVGQLHFDDATSRRAGIELGQRYAVGLARFVDPLER